MTGVCQVDTLPTDDGQLFVLWVDRADPVIEVSPELVLNPPAGVSVHADEMTVHGSNMTVRYRLTGWTPRGDWIAHRVWVL